MKLTKKYLQKGQTVRQGNIAIRLTNGIYLVQDYTGNWYEFETYKEAKAEYLDCIKNAEYLKLQ